LDWKIVVGHRRFINGREEEDCKNIIRIIIKIILIIITIII
jgi:hypothetical protein